MKPTDSELLRAALERLEIGTCKEALAKDAGGVPVSVLSPNAVSWCGIGALMFAAERLGAHEEQRWRLAHWIFERIFGTQALKDAVYAVAPSFVYLNDKYPERMAPAFRELISLLESEEEEMA